MAIRSCAKCGAAFAGAAARCPCCGADADAAPGSPSAEHQPQQPTSLAPDAFEAGSLLWLAGIAACAAIGWLLGGPAGAGVGALVGLVLVSVGPAG
jgi:hypothetical protein